MPRRSTSQIPTETERRMRALLKEQARSGRTLTEFSRRRGIPRVRLSWWKGEIRRREGVRSGSRPRRTPRLLPVEVTGSSAPPVWTRDLVIELRSGHRVHVPVGVDLCVLQSVLRLLEESC